jgi:hypothetical protein
MIGTWLRSVTLYHTSACFLTTDFTDFARSAFRELKTCIP